MFSLWPFNNTDRNMELTTNNERSMILLRLFFISLFSIAVLMSVPLANSVAGQEEAQEWSPNRVDSHAPIGVMGDHKHEKGEVMFSYRLMTMRMEGSRDGTTSLKDSDITSATGAYKYMMTPTEMDMEMHMFGIMVGLSDNITLMGMLPAVRNSMSVVNRMGMGFNTSSGGFGDAKIGAMIGLAENSIHHGQSLHLNAMLSIPNGSITEKNVLPTSNGMPMQLPYPMQIGSGTFDLLPAITWLGQFGAISWGTQANATIRLGTNERNWALGNRYSVTGWLARILHPSFSAALRLNASTVGDIKGSDGMLNAMMTPAARTDLRSGETVEGGFSLNFYLPKLKAFRIALEGLYPLYRNLDGPQLETDWTFMIGLQIVPIK